MNKPVLIELWDQRFFYFVLKFEFNYIDAMDKASALSTVQIDVENAERYGIKYIDSNIYWMLALGGLNLKEKIDNPGIVICDPLEVYLKLKSEIDIIEKSIATQKDNLISSDENLIKKYIPQRDFLESETSSLKL